MKIRTAAAGAAMFAGLIIGTPAWAICLPLWGTVCRPAGSPPADATATAPEAKPRKPLNLRVVAHKGGKRVHVATRHRQPPAARVAKQAPRNAVAARSRVAAARRVASARRRPTIEARREDAAKEAMKTPPPALRDEVAQVTAAVASSAPATNGTASPPAPQTDGYVPAQNEVTELDLAADHPKVTPPAADAPNPALWNAVTPTDPAANAGVAAPSADSANVAPANNSVAPASNQVASADPPNRPEAAPLAQQQPADEPSWLRRILIGVGGVLTLASAVRLFVG